MRNVKSSASPRMNLFEQAIVLYREKRTKALFVGLFLALMVSLPFLARTLPFFRFSSVPIADLRSLPSFALFSLLRLLLALALSFLFSLIYGTLAAKNRALEKILIPTLDILQSVPVLGFFPAAIYFFVKIGGESRLGVEMACIFLIFTSQAWNMTFGVYESIRGIPKEIDEASRLLGIRGFSYFRRVLFPACVVKLVYNAMLSWAAGWYFLIACEILAIGPVSFRLPGLGSFISEATQQGRLDLLAAGISVLVVLVVVMDVLCFRPLVVISEKYKLESQSSSEESEESYALDFFRRLKNAVKDKASALTKGVQDRRWLKAGHRWSKASLRILRGGLGRMRAKELPKAYLPLEMLKKGKIGLEIAAFSLLGGGVLFGLGYGIYRWILLLATQPWPKEVLSLPLGLLLSFCRLLVAFAFCLGWTLPVAFLASRSKRVLRFSARACQILAAIPATAFFPLFVALAVKTGVGMELASILLLATGMQWYLLFNLLAGVRAIPQDLREVAQVYGIRGTGWLRFFILPCLYPSFVTGAITAFGGGWNALIISEYVVYRRETYVLKGVGALLDRGIYDLGDPVLISVSLAAMITFIVLMNRLFWAPLSEKISSRYRLEGG
ncbi:MAG: ABC transporter permease subunit [Nitrospirota bacterium]|nr:ABC transporter permease subunit [Nitrospirota bacterium]